MPVFLWIGDVYFYFRESHDFSRGSMSIPDSVIHGFLRFTTQQLVLEFPLSSLLHPCKRFHGFFWPFGPASIITARIHHVLTGTTTRTYRFVLPFELPTFPSQRKQNLTAAASRRQPSHKYRYSRRSWHLFSAPSYTIYLLKQFSKNNWEGLTMHLCPSSEHWILTSDAGLLSAGD